MAHAIQQNSCVIFSPYSFINNSILEYPNFDYIAGSFDNIRVSFAFPTHKPLSKV